MRSPLVFIFAFFIALASQLSIYALFSALFTERVEAVRETLQAGLSRNFWLGLVNSLFVFAVMAALLGIAENSGLQFFALLATLVAGFYLVGAAYGLSALSQLLGQRLFPAREALPAQMRGGLVMVLAAMSPYVGWFLILPYLLLVAFGSFVSLLFQSWRSR